MKKWTIGVASLLVIAAQVNGQDLSKEYAVNINTDKEINTRYPTYLSNKDEDADDPMKAKKFSKSFSADRTDKINLSNKYGSMQIKIWNKAEVKVDIDVKAYSNSDADAQKLLDEVSIDAVKQGDLIVCKTNIGSENNNWGRGSRNGRKWRREVKVDYIVYMPSANALTLSQQYGNVDLPLLSGALSAKVQYGNFNAGTLSGNNNYISVQYGKTTIQKAEKATIKQQYGSGLSIGTVGTLDLNAQYSKVDITTINGNAQIRQQYGSGLTIGSVENLDLNIQYANANISTIKGNGTISQQYNKLSIGTVGKLNLRAQYTGADIGTLRGDGNFDMQYNNLNINEIGVGCKALDIDARYVGVSLGFGSSYNAQFDVEIQYASFKYGSKVTSHLTGEGDDGSSSTKNYTGKIGNGSAARVHIKSAYGSVNFK